MSVKVNLSAARKRAEESGLLGGGSVWKPKEGDNRIRFVSEWLEHPGEYTGKDGVTKKTFKWLCFILDRVDGEVKPYFMPNNIYEQIETLQLNPDYAFDEVPMPYDITLNVKNAGKLDVIYSVMPARANTPLTQVEVEKITAAGSIREYQKTVYESQSQSAGSQPATEAVPMPQEAPATPDRYASIPPEFRPRA